MKKLLLTFLLFILATPAFAGFSYSRSIVINASQVNGNTGSLTQFPVLVCGNSSAGPCNISVANMATVSNGGHVTSSSGYDINFFKNSNCTSPLTWEMENYSSSSGEFEAWVTDTGTALSGTVNTTWYMCYGNSSITTFQSTASSVWDSFYAAVYHFSSSGGLTLTDSTTNGITLTNQNSATSASSLIDGTVAVANASSQYLVNTTTYPAFGSTGNSYEVIVNANSFPNAYNTVVGIDGGTNSYFDLHIKSDGKLALYMFAGGLVHYDDTGSNTLSTGTSYWLGMTYTVGTGTLVGYVNGSQDNTGTGGVGPMNFSPSDFQVSNNLPDSGGRYFDGQIDELRVSSGARSAGWMSTDYNNQSAPSSFYTLGSEISLGHANLIQGVSKIQGVSLLN